VPDERRIRLESGTPVSVWEERWHPLREEWVIVAAHRQNRPWIGETVASKREVAPAYLPDCYLFPATSE
jgi:UDPglucose--hexose-1-phosphate uridylyltransferase